MTHEDLVLKYIDDFGSITTWQAMVDLGVGCLTKTISNIRKDGTAISTTMTKGKNRYGKTIHYAVYTKAV